MSFLCALISSALSGSLWSQLHLSPSLLCPPPPALYSFILFHLSPNIGCHSCHVRLFRPPFISFFSIAAMPPCMSCSTFRLVYFLFSTVGRMEAGRDLCPGLSFHCVTWSYMFGRSSSWFQVSMNRWRHRRNPSWFHLETACTTTFLACRPCCR